MKKRIFAITLLCFAALTAASIWKRHELFRRAAGMPEFTAPGFTERTETVTMRDGIKLHTEIFLPEGATSSPTILVRNPYEYLRPIERLTCQTMTRYGYGCVLQDARGQMDSEGDWEPIIHERDDGLDTLAWLTKQPFQNGNLAMRGPSYLTCTQWAMADALPPEVKTLVPSVFGTDLRKVFYERGLFRHDILTAWATLMPGRGMRQLAGNDYLEAAKHRPIIESDERFMTRRVGWYQDAIAAENPSNPYWHSPQQLQFRAMPENVNIPMLYVGAFFDPFFMAHLDTWDRLKTRDQSVYVIGPWNHLGLTSGDLDFGNAPGRLDQWPLMLEWFDHTLKGKPLTTLKRGTVRTFAINDTKWVEHPSWPEASVPAQIFNLSGSQDAAQSCTGGALGPATATNELHYTFDPANPVSTQGGASLLSFAFFRNLGITPGPVEQGKTCARDDVLTFRTEPITQPQRLSGPGKLLLHVKSSAPDTAFVARLIAEQNGQSVLVRENAATLRWPTGNLTGPATYEPNGTATIEIDFWPIEWVLPAGGRWRIDLTSSSFPALHTHSNRATPWQLETGADKAEQTVLLEGSALTLPLSGT